MSKVLLAVGLCQIIAGGVIVGLAGKYFDDTLSGIKIINDSTKLLDNTVNFGIIIANAFGPVLIGLLVVANGVFGILSMCCSNNKKIEVFYLIGAAVAASANAAMVWISSIELTNVIHFTTRYQPATKSTELL